MLLLSVLTYVHTSWTLAPSSTCLSCTIHRAVSKAKSCPVAVCIEVTQREFKGTSVSIRYIKFFHDSSINPKHHSESACHDEGVDMGQGRIGWCLYTHSISSTSCLPNGLGLGTASLCTICNFSSDVDDSWLLYNAYQSNAHTRGFHVQSTGGIPQTHSCPLRAFESGHATSQSLHTSHLQQEVLLSNSMCGMSRVCNNHNSWKVLYDGTRHECKCRRM